MATQTVLSRTQYEVLRLFANGKTEREIADYTTLEGRAVTRTVNELCAGDRGVAADLAADYERRAAAVAAAKGTPPPARPPVPPIPPAMARATDVLADLLAAAEASRQQRTRSLGAKLSALAEDLRSRLGEERREAEAAAAAAKARAEAKRRVDELAAELAKAREQLRAAGGPADRPAKATAARPAGDVLAKTVREWAAAAGIECAPKGKIPGPVMDAYRQHHTSEQTGDQG